MLYLLWPELAWWGGFKYINIVNIICGSTNQITGHNIAERLAVLECDLLVPLYYSSPNSTILCNNNTEMILIYRGQGTLANTQQHLTIINVISNAILGG